MSTTVERTVQIVEEGKTSSSLRVHEASADDPTLPACGTPIRPWNGITMVGRPLGSGVVTCQRCHHVTKEAS
jgi:hypothetical protein